MGTKFTKGDWVFDDINMKIKGSGDIEGRTVIANVSPNMDFSRGMGTQTANAKLIAASPDLLAACKQCLQSLEMFVKDGYIMPRTKAENLARKAITKATK